METSQLKSLNNFTNNFQKHELQLLWKSIYKLFMKYRIAYHVVLNDFKILQSLLSSKLNNFHQNSQILFKTERVAIETSVLLCVCELNENN